MFGRALKYVSCFVVSFLLAIPFAHADDYDAARQKYFNMLTGGTSYDPNDPDVAALITTITTTANTNWSTMVAGDTTRPYLWSDLPDFGTVSAQVTNMATRLEQMALAYSTYGSSLYGNSSLLAAIIGGMDWMYANCYNSGIREYNNWWDWEIGTPLQFNNTMVLLYGGLNTTQIANYSGAIDHFTPKPKGTGANLLWTSTIVAIRGIIVKDSSKISVASTGISPLFQYSTGDGFHTDGSFLQHTGRFAYNGGYGLQILSDLPPFIQLLQGTSWAVTDPAQSNMFQWIYNAYAPLIYKGGFMSMVRGRNISRSTAQDHKVGHSAMEYLLSWADIAPAADALKYKQMIRYWAQQDSFTTFIPNIVTIAHLLEAKAMIADSTISPMAEPVTNKPYPEMDRVVHLRAGYGFGISMYSTRIGNFESINGENLHGWHTGSGMTYLYNADLGHYDQDYWPTVNSYRLPGTTVDTQTLADGAYNWSFSTQSWVGSANILGLYGTAGMQLMTQGSTLTANKSWFMFDDEIVALGSDINSSDNRTIETIVENRHIASTDNALTVNGVAQATTVPWSTTLTNVNWMHLAGSAASGADIGYFFPASAVVQALRETRSSSWSTIKTTESTNTVTGNYVTLWLDHGANPAEATYAYVLLPNKSASQVGAYATNPDIAILEQSSVAHAVKEKTLNVIGANFWQDVSHSVDMITSDRKAIVMTQENPHQDLTVAVADPTQLGSSIDIEITRSASDIITADNTITITQLSPTIKFTVNVSNALGHTQNVKFNLGSSTNPPSAPANLSATAVSTSGINLAWTASTDAASYAVLRSTTNGGPYTNIAAGLLSTSYRDTGLAGGATYYYLVQAINSAGTSPASAQASAATWAPLTTTLSINFQGTGTAMATTESAGVVAAGNWNNAAGASGSLSSLADKNGVVTAAAVSWSSHNTWSTPITDTAGSKRMMKGYLDNSDTSTTSVTVSGLPSSYTVYVYCDGDNRTTTKTGIYMIGNTNITATDTGNVNFSGTFVQANNSAGNYIVFPNQTASSFTLTATGTSTDPGPRAPINGIQIVPTGPQPLTTTLSINFQGNGTAMATTESAGVVAAGNWNNAAGTSGALSSMADKNGTATTVSVNWSSNDTWSTPITDTAGNNRMMKGYLDTSNASTTSVIVSGLPSTYTVYLYCDGYNNTAKRTGRYTLGNTTVTATDAASTNFSGTFVQANNSAGNYIVFPNQTASSFTITATGTSTDTTPRAPINGIQIVP